jgi:hypothetical protein
MKRRNFIELLTVTGGAIATTSLVGFTEKTVVKEPAVSQPNGKEKLSADIIIAGGGLGGFAAAMAALRNNQTVILTEETDWIGGQLTSQGVPPDEHMWIETHGATQFYLEFRNAVRDYYKKYYPLTDEAKNREFLNPGDGSVSKLCHEPKVAVAVLTNMFAPYESAGKLVVLLEHRITAAKASSTKVSSLTALDLRSKKSKTLVGEYFVDATDLGELLPLTGTAFVVGTESRNETREIHAPLKANPKSNQSFTACFAMDYVPGGNFVIDKPSNYEFWSKHVPDLEPAWAGKLLALHYSDPRTLKPKNLGFHPEGHKMGSMLNLWNYRKIINKNNFKPGVYAGDITIVNWPQNDYMLNDLIGTTPEQFAKYYEEAKQLSLSLLYWLQTEAPRPDGGKGWPGLRLRKDVMGTEDGLAKYPYIRESRRIKAVFTVLEEHVGKENRAKVAEKDGHLAAPFYDSVGVGYYHIDLHPSSDRVNYVDFPSLPFQIPLGALLPVKMENLLPANKNIGTTHITNGCYRLHPVEWSIGESVGMLITFAKSKNVIPRKVRENKELLAEFQAFVRSQGIATEWPKK